MKYFSLLVLPDEGELAKVLPTIRLAITTMDGAEMVPDISNAFTYRSEADSHAKHLLDVTKMIQSIVSDSKLDRYHYTAMTEGEKHCRIYINTAKHC